MFERFTEKAIKAIMLSQEEARRLGHNFLGTEQLLLGLIGEANGLAGRSLKSHGVTLKDARVEVEKIIGRGSGYVAVEIPFTPRCKRVLELAWDVARQLGHNYLGTEHLLLGLIAEGEGVAARILENLGVELTNLKSTVMTYITIPLPGAVVLPNFQNSGEVANPLSGVEVIKQFESEIIKLKERISILEVDKTAIQSEYNKLVAAAGQAVTTLEKADKVIDAYNTVVDLLLAKFIEYGHKEDKT